MRPQVRALFPEGVAGVEVLDAGEAEPLFPEEAAHLSRAVDKRRVEFAWGRTCARRALSQHGVPPQALLANPDRSVAWPDGFIGSITHAERYVAAVVAPTPLLLGIGMDAELAERVYERLWKQIASDEEIAWIGEAEHEAAARGRATLLFSAKEAFYKAQFCISQAWVGFHDAHFTCDEQTQTFAIELTRDIERLASASSRFTGRYTRLGEHVITACCITEL